MCLPLYHGRRIAASRKPTAAATLGFHVFHLHSKVITAFPASSTVVYARMSTASPGSTCDPAASQFQERLPFLI